MRTAVGLRQWIGRYLARVVTLGAVLVVSFALVTARLFRLAVRC